MRRLSKSHWQNIPPVKLYREDVEHLDSMIREAVDKTRLETDDYALDNVTELFELKRPLLTTLTYRTREPDLTIKFQPGSAFVHAHEDTPLSIGLAEKVGAFLRAKRNKPLVLWYHLHPLAVAPFGALLSLAFTLKGLAAGYRAGLGAFSLIAIIVIVTSAYWARLRRHSQIVLTYKSEVPGFWKRNGDNIIINMVVALVSAILGALLTYWLGGKGK